MLKLKKKYTNLTHNFTMVWYTLHELPAFLFLLPVVLFQFQQTHQRGTTSAHHQRLLALQLAWPRQKKDKGQNSNSSIESTENKALAKYWPLQNNMPHWKNMNFSKEEHQQHNRSQKNSLKKHSSTHLTPTTPPSEAGNNGATRPPWKHFSKKESENNQSVYLCFYLCIYL